MYYGEDIYILILILIPIPVNAEFLRQGRDSDNIHGNGFICHLYSCEPKVLNIFRKSRILYIVFL